MHDHIQTLGYIYNERERVREREKDKSPLIASLQTANGRSGLDFVGMGVLGSGLMVHTNWNQGEPDNNFWFGGEDCVNIYTKVSISFHHSTVFEDEYSK